MTFDPRTFSKPVYAALTDLRKPYDKLWEQAQSDAEKTLYRNHLKEQKNQAIELYTYLATWGLMRLKAEEMALDKGKPDRAAPKLRKKEDSKLTNQEEPSLFQRKQEAKNKTGKRKVIIAYFECLQALSAYGETKNLAAPDGLNVLMGLGTEEYLGLTGLGLALAQEFCFWATAVYHDISGDDAA